MRLILSLCTILCLLSSCKTIDTYLVNAGLGKKGTTRAMPPEFPQEQPQARPQAPASVAANPAYPNQYPNAFGQNVALPPTPQNVNPAAPFYPANQTQMQRPIVIPYYYQPGY